MRQNTEQKKLQKWTLFTQCSYSVLKDFYLKLKKILLLLTRGLFFNFLQMFKFTMFFRCWATLWNSRLKMTTLYSTLSQVTNINVEIDNSDSTSSKVLDFNGDVRNVISKLIWRISIPWRHIDLTSIIQQYWNIC